MKSLGRYAGQWTPLTATFTAAGGETVFYAPFLLSDVDVFVNGDKLYQSEFTVDAAVSKVTLNSAVVLNDLVIIRQMVPPKLASYFTTSTATNFSSTDAITFPSGTAQQRPVTAPIGAVRYNTSVKDIEIYDGSNWSYASRPLIISSIEGNLFIDDARCSLTFNFERSPAAFRLDIMFGDLLLYTGQHTVLNNKLVFFIPGALGESLSGGEVVTFVFRDLNNGDTYFSVVKQAGTKPSGGTYSVNSDTGYAMNLFTTSSDLITTSSLDVSFQLGAGGGGGAYYSGTGGGGAGAGGMIQQSITLGAGTYPIVLGAGGGVRSNGGNSTFNGLTAIGGGVGGSYPTSTRDGQNGGSGGGVYSAGVSYGLGTAGQGHDGGGAQYDGNGRGGGGGGYSSAGGFHIAYACGGIGGDGLYCFDGVARCGGGSSCYLDTQTPLGGSLYNQGGGVGLARGAGGYYNGGGGSGFFIIQYQLFQV